MPALHTDAEAEAWLEQNITHARSVGVTGVEGELTPALARCLLERNEENRPISQTNLNRLCNDIRSDRWALNGQWCEVPCILGTNAH